MNPPAATAAAGERATATLAVIATTLLLQFALQAAFFPFPALFDATTLTYIDAPFHQYQIEVARQLCAEGQVTGYDLFFAAGHLGGVTFNASAKLPALLACMIGSPESVGTIYKQFSFWSGVLAPALLVLTCHLLRLPASVAALAAILAVLCWWTGAIRWYHTAGMVAYILAAHACIPFAVAAARTCARPAAGPVVLLTLLAALGLLLHPLFAVAAALVALPLLIVDSEATGKPARTLAVASTLLLGMLALNAFWLVESLSAPSFVTVANPYQRVVDPALPLRELLGTATTAAGGSRLYGGLLLGAALCIAFCKGPQRRALLALVAASVLLLLWASLGALLQPLAALQPNRFSALAWLCLLVPAAAGVQAAAVQWSSSRGTGRWLRGGPLAAIGVLVLFFVYEGWHEIFAPADAPRYAVAPPEARGSGELSREIIAFLRQHTDRSARVLFENSLGRVHDRGHQAGLYALASDREFIGGPYPFTDFASAWDRYVFGSAHDRHSPQAMTDMLDAFNVRWMLCHSQGCRAAMSALPGVQELAVLGPVVAYGRTSSPGFVVRGQARIVDRCINRLELADVSGSPLILRYHWVPGLVSLPAGRVEPVQLVAGARPFVAIHDAPPSRLTLRVGTKPGLPCDARVGRAH
ncbi:MAG TPA: hypothetical protein PK440_05380 [Candidatus Accumulibacter phosphatis]|nr:hypothetical protein [Candidatus Accumulibacter phosphatis]HRQ94429.1 hypothetical protein [Candidatus Accumulibacter phosphatis]